MMKKMGHEIIHSYLFHNKKLQGRRILFENPVLHALDFSESRQTYAILEDKFLLIIAGL